MKKIICLLLVALLLVPFGTAALAANAGAAEAFRAESFSNTALADASAESTDGASITGKVNTSFEFNGDGKAVLTQNSTTVQSVDIAADGTYTLTALAAGEYDLLISVPGWTDYNVYDISVSEDETVEIYENTIIAGDVNKDNSIDIQDVAAVLQEVGKTVDTDNSGCDVNHDSYIDIADVTNILTEQNYLEKAYSSYWVNNGYSETY